MPAASAKVASATATMNVLLPDFYFWTIAGAFSASGFAWFEANLPHIGIASSLQQSGSNFQTIMGRRKSNRLSRSVRIVIATVSPLGMLETGPAS